MEENTPSSQLYYTCRSNLSSCVTFQEFPNSPIKNDQQQTPVERKTKQQFHSVRRPTWAVSTFVPLRSTKPPTSPQSFHLQVDRLAKRRNLFRNCIGSLERTKVKANSPFKISSTRWVQHEFFKTPHRFHTKSRFAHRSPCLRYKKHRTIPIAPVFATEALPSLQMCQKHRIEEQKEREEEEAVVDFKAKPINRRALHGDRIGVSVREEIALRSQKKQKQQLQKQHKQQQKKQRKEAEQRPIREVRPFVLETDIRGEMQRNEWRRTLVENEEKENQQHEFHANKYLPAVNAANARVKESGNKRPSTTFDTNFVLHSEERAKERRVFDEKLEEKHRQEEEEQQKRTQEQKELEEREIREYRRMLTHHAQPILPDSIVKIKHSSRHTVPKSPKLHVKQRAILRQLL